MIGGTCETCEYFNFKVSGDHAWGNCLQPEAMEAQRISFSHVDELYELPNPIHAAVKKYAKILYREDIFGCRLHRLRVESDNKAFAAEPEPAAKVSQ